MPPSHPAPSFLTGMEKETPTPCRNTRGHPARQWGSMKNTHPAICRATATLLPSGCFLGCQDFWRQQRRALGEAEDPGIRSAYPRLPPPEGAARGSASLPRGSCSIPSTQQPVQGNYSPLRPPKLRGSWHFSFSGQVQFFIAFLRTLVLRHSKGAALKGASCSLQFIFIS